MTDFNFVDLNIHIKNTTLTLTNGNVFYNLQTCKKVKKNKFNYRRKQIGMENNIVKADKNRKYNIR